MPTLDARLRELERAGPYVAPPNLEAVAKAAKKAGMALLRVDLKGVHDKQGLLDAIATALKFPEWFGENWDALEDCLTDLSWQKARGYVLVLEHCAELAKHAPRELEVAVEVFENVAEYWQEQDRPFWALFSGLDAPLSGIKLLT